SGTATITTPSSPVTTVTGLVAGTTATVRWTVSNGTCSAFDEVVVRNNIAPSPPVSGGNITECKEPSMQTLTAIATVPEGYSIIWYDSATDGAIVQNPTLNAVNTITYYVEAVDNATSCVSLNRTPVTLTIKTCLIAIVKTNDIAVGPNDCATLKVGDIVTYTFTVTNLGNETLNNIVVADPHAGLSAIELQSGDLNTNSLLEVNEIWVYEAVYTVTQADIDNGSITNQASVTGIASDETQVTDQSGDSTTNNTPNVISICTAPHIALVKTNDITVGENGCATLVVGDVVTYTFTVTNPGNVSLHDVTVLDPHIGLSAIALQSGDANENSILDVTETWIYNATYTVTQADIDNGNITNQASAIATAPDTTIVTDQSGNSATDDANNVIPICTNPAIAIVKTNDIAVGENGCASLVVGDVVTYTFTVTNPGNVSLHDVTVLDPHTGLSAIALQSGDANENSILDVTETWVYKATYTVTQPDIDNGSITNQASANGIAPDDTQVGDQSGNSATDDANNVIPICTTPAIAIVKTNDITVGENGCASLVVGDVVTYTFTVTNPGNVSLHDVTVLDPHTGLSAIALQSGDANENSILDVTETWFYKATYTVTQADIDNGSITNQASAKGIAPDDTQVGDQSGDSATDDTNNVIPICTTPAIAIVKTNDITTGENGCATLVVGDVVTYTFTVTNPGNVSLHDVTVLDPHTGLSAIALESGDLNANNILEVNETWIYKATYTVTQSDIDNGSITNQASANGIAPDDTQVGDQSGDSATDDANNVIPICTTPAIAIVKTNDITAGENGCATLVVGDVVTYTFTVTNSGNVSLHDLTVLDHLTGLSAIALQSGDANENSILDVTETWVYKATYTVTQSDIDNGGITNQASVTGIAPDDTQVSDQSGDSATDDTNNVIPICTTANIAITKDGTYQDTNGDGITNIGDDVIYNFVVTNTGNLTLTNITITDNNAVISGGPLASLGAGASDSTTFTAVHAITQDDIDAGIVYNLSTATGTPPDAPDVSATSTDPTPCTSCPISEECPDCTITTLTQTPSISLVKTGAFIDANSDGYAQVGETINYTFIVYNTGNVTLTNVIITDPLIGLIISGNPITILGPGATNNNVTGVYSITQANIDAGLVINSALAIAQDPKGNDVIDISGTAIDNDTPTETPLSQTPEIALVKTSTFSDTNNDGYPQAGEIINYNFTVTNTGNVLITNIIITDPLVGLILTGNPIASLAPGTTNSSESGIYTITQADIDAGSVTNSALVTGKDPLENDVTDISGTTVENNTPTITPLIQNPGLEVIKTANNENYSSVGDILNYTIQVRNTGNVTLYQITVTDELTGLTTIIESLAPGSTQEFTQSYTVTQSDRENSSVTNLAEADGFTPNETPIHAEDSAEVEAAIVLGCQTITVHNAFSPNGDGINEVFVIENLEDVLCYPNNSLEIYNRWGVLVFETTNYNNTSNYFNGVSRGRTTISQSAGLPTGTYFYILNYTSIEGTGGVKNNTKDGYLYLTR
ncbi:DUF7507 domain-containing protein, partial [Flavobacterium sp. W22_SRS_FP1]|uniref:DUF7507 domain-containing protein n=1 Tax=Flavobacterium sp. W22_SRS_FP1 TaxID=3240276 RepID=UPI003F91B107